MSDRIINPDKVANAISKWETPPVPVNVVVAGKHGSGKTTLVSALCDKPVKKEENVAMILRNKCHCIPEHKINVWDACGLYETSRSRKSELAVKIMKEIKCLSENNNVVLVYTVSINQNRFLDDLTENSDINCIKILTDTFGKRIWERSVIVLTFVNDDYFECGDDLEGTNQLEKQQSYMQRIKEFKTMIKEFLQKFYILEDEANNLIFEPAGYIRDATSLKSLECSSKGIAWDFNIWFRLAQRAPMNTQYQLLKYCFQKMFQNPLLYFDSFLDLIKIHGQLYMNVSCMTEENEEENEDENEEEKEELRKIGKGYSYLRLLKEWFDYYYLRQQNQTDFLGRTRFICSVQTKEKIKFWMSLNTTVKIVVTGDSHVGKTSLINSMLYQKLQFQEIKDFNVSITSEYKSIKCSFVELPISSLSKASLDNTALMLVCIKFNDTEENMTRTLTNISKKQFSDFMVVLTFAEESVSLKTSWKETVRQQERTIKSVLKKLEVRDEIIETLRVIPASYHTREVISTDETTNKNWIMDVWLNSIASAKTDSQSALVLYVNHFIYGGSKRKAVLPEHKIFYRDTFLTILHEITQRQGLSYD